MTQPSSSELHAMDAGRTAETMALRHALRVTRDTTPAVDGRMLRDAACALVAGLKADGLPIERIVRRVKTLAAEAGFPMRARDNVEPSDEHLRILLDEIIRICVEAYYR